MWRVEHDMGARLELKITASSNDLRRQGWLVSSPASSIVMDIVSAGVGRGSMFPKNARP